MAGASWVAQWRYSKHLSLYSCSPDYSCCCRTNILFCLSQEEGDQCQFVEWLDEPWPERVQESLKMLWKELKVTRRCEAMANEALHDALETSDTAMLAHVTL